MAGLLENKPEDHDEFLFTVEENFIHLGFRDCYRALQQSGQAANDDDQLLASIALCEASEEWKRFTIEVECDEEYRWLTELRQRFAGGSMLEMLRSGDISGTN